jgi:hypothetical protein
MRRGGWLGFPIGASNGSIGCEQAMPASDAAIIGAATNRAIQSPVSLAAFLPKTRPPIPRAKSWELEAWSKKALRAPRSTLHAPCALPYGFDRSDFAG